MNQERERLKSDVIREVAARMGWELKELELEVLENPDCRGAPAHVQKAFYELILNSARPPRRK